MVTQVEDPKTRQGAGLAHYTRMVSKVSELNHRTPIPHGFACRSSSTGTMALLSFLLEGHSSQGHRMIRLWNAYDTNPRHRFQTGAPAREIENRRSARPATQTSVSSS
jgi:hypothetical protein